MKKLITPLIIIVAFLAVAALSYSVAEHYNNYQNSRKAAENQEKSQDEVESQARIEALETQLAGETQRNERLMGECQKGVVAFSNLSAFHRANLEEPVCEEVLPSVEEPVAPPVQ